MDLASPPQSIISEQSVIGALLLSPQSLDRIEWLEAPHFYAHQHREIYAVLRPMVEAGQTVDAVTVADALDRAGKLETIGGRSYLSDLALATPSAANIVAYAKAVRDKFILRELQSHAVAIHDAAQSGIPPEELAQQAEARFLSVLETGGGEEVSFATAVAEAVDAEGEHQKSTSTGFPNLDGMLSGSGMRPGQLFIIAGRSSMGKSALALNIAEHVAKSETVAFFTLEMTRQELAERSLKYHASLVGKSAAVLHLMELKMQVDHTPAVTLGHIRMRLRRIKRRHGLGLVVVDYLQLMRGDGENRTQEVGSLSRGLKAIAKEFSVPVIAVAQINRAVESRGDKRPMLSDLRESGDIENDADTVLMIYREDYYQPDTPARGLAEVIIRKQRGGPVGTVHMSFDALHTRFHAYTGPVPSYQPAAPRGGKVMAADFKMRAGGE